MYERFPTRLIPELWRSPPDVYFRAGVLVALSITLMAITAGCFFVALFAYDLPVVAWANLGALVMSALALLSIARGISLRLSTDLLCSSTIVAVAVVVGAVEGLTSPALIWLTGVPLVAALGAGWRRAVGWTSIMLAAVVGLVVLDHFGLLTNRELPVEVRRITAAWNVGLFAAFVFGCAAMYEFVRVRAMSYLHDLHVEEHSRHTERAQAQHLSALGDLSSTLAQEAHGPLCRAFADLYALEQDLALDIDSPPEVRRTRRRLAEEALAAMNRAVSAFNDLQWLGPARPPEVSTFRFSAVIEAAVRLRSGLKVDVPGDLFVVADAQRVEQVVTFLLETAAEGYDYSAGPVHLRAARADARTLEARIGAGSAALEAGDLAGHHRDDPIAPPTLGVRMCQLLVEAMNGTLEVRRTPRGTPAFSLRLPLAEGVPLSFRPGPTVGAAYVLN